MDKSNSTIQQPREETITDVRLAYSLRAAGDLVDYLERTYRGALPEEQEAVAALLAEALKTHRQIKSTIQSR